MEKIIFRLMVLTSAGCLALVRTKHVHLEKELSWSAAQEYCRKHDTDLSRLSSKQEDLFLKFVDPNDEGWIGVYWNQTTDTWRWSGGENVTFWKILYKYMNHSYELQEPPTHAHNIYWTKDKWLTRIGSNNQNFLCLSLTVVQEEKTWEGALELCRKNDSDLSSLLSETRNLRATNEIQQTSVTDPVWIDLRYLGDVWLWVNGDHQCPAKNRCGALTKGGVWENRDCQEKLSFICG